MKNLLILLMLSFSLFSCNNSVEIKEKKVVTKKVIKVNQDCIKGCNFYYEIFKSAKKINKKAPLSFKQIEALNTQCRKECLYEEEKKEERVEIKKIEKKIKKDLDSLSIEDLEKL